MYEKKSLSAFTNLNFINFFIEFYNKQINSTTLLGKQLFSTMMRYKVFTNFGLRILYRSLSGQVLKIKKKINALLNFVVTFYINFYGYLHILLALYLLI